jgi:hypothetical protein
LQGSQIFCNGTLNLGIVSSTTDNMTVYRTRFLPNPNGYSFPNYNGATATPTPEKMVRGQHSIEEFLHTYNIDKSTYNNNPSYQKFFTNNFQDDSNGGNCFGMSATSLMLYNKRINNAFSYTNTSVVPSDWLALDPFKIDPLDYYVPITGPLPITVENWISAYQPIQHDVKCQNDIVNNMATTNLDPSKLKNVYKILKNDLDKGLTD